MIAVVEHRAGGPTDLPLAISCADSTLSFLIASWRNDRSPSHSRQPLPSPNTQNNFLFPPNVTLLTTAECQAINSGVSEINTVGLTGVYAALGSDPTLFSLLTKPHEVKRNRRLLFLLIFWGGAALGGAIATFSDMWISLILALECKVVALGMMMLSSAFEVPDGWAEEHAKVEREKGKGKGREEEEVDTWAD